MRASWAGFLLLGGLMTAQAGPRLAIGFVGLPPGATAANCASAAKSALDPSFGNVRLENGNAHAFNDTYTVILYCDVDVRQAYILISGNQPGSTVRSVEDLKAQIKVRLLHSLPGSRAL